MSGTFIFGIAMIIISTAIYIYYSVWVYVTVILILD